jgi:hypothetical protein
MDVTYIAAAPALARLHHEHHRPDRQRHHREAARLRRERSYVRGLLRRARARRTFGDLAPLSTTTPTAATATTAAGTSRRIGTVG